MSRPRSAALTQALAAIQSGMLPAEAARQYGINKSSVSRALKRPVCPCCGQAIHKKAAQ